jgi:Yip1 domain
MVVDFSKLFARVKNILITPKAEWPVIAAEPDTVLGLYKNYIAILAAIPAVIVFVRYSVLGITVPIVGGTYRLGVGAGIAQMIVTYIVSLGVTYLMMLVIDALAPSFGGQKNQVQALKSIAYAYTASWVASVLTLIGGLGFLIILLAGIYGIYLLYLGLPHTMKCPQDKAGGYAAVTIILAILLSIVLGFVLASVTGLNAVMGGAFSGATHSSSYTPDKNNPLGALAAIGEKAAEAGKQMEQAQKSGDANAQAEATGKAVGQVLGAVLGGGDSVEALAPDALKPFLPDSLAGMPRTSMEVERNAAIGIQVSNAKATYRNAQGGGEIRLEITDTGGAKGIMALAGFAGMEQDKQTENGYEKTYRQDGRLVHEQWNNGGDGEFSIVLGDRFIVEVHGSGMQNIDALKAAVGGLNLAGLEALKGQGVKKG